VFRGCAMLNAAAQHHVEAVRAITARHLSRQLELLTGIARDAGAADPRSLGRQLLMLVEGATVAAHHDAAAAGETPARRHSPCCPPRPRPAAAEFGEAPGACADAARYRGRTGVGPRRTRRGTDQTNLTRRGRRRRMSRGRR
jgi:hypothetical protein